MSGNDDNHEVYHNLTETGRKDNQAQGGWTLYLTLCCLTVCTASLIFGFNIGVTNLPTPLIKEFFGRRYYLEHYDSLDAHRKAQDDHSRDQETIKITDLAIKLDNLNLQLNDPNVTSENKKSLQDQIKEIESESKKETKLSVNERIEKNKAKLDELRKNESELEEKTKKIDAFNDNLWTILNVLFVVGGMVGAFTSKYVADFFGRKKGILFHHIFTFSGSVLVFIAPLVNSPECVLASRFLFGVQGGMACGLIPTYLAEISSAKIRGATGVLNQLGITIGIFLAQTLGFRQLLGVKSMWHILLALPIVPGLVGFVSLLLFFPETPKALLMNNKDEESARKALYRLRNSTEVSHEIEEMKKESRESKSDEAISLTQLFTLTELRWPLITGLILQLTQQLCGVNAIFFYSERIFRSGGIEAENIQYAVFLTGFINVIMTFVCIPLIDRLGRKPLLIYPMIIIVFDFILLTFFLRFKGSFPIFSYLSIVCIILFIMCFAVGLGPIPFFYVTECFRQDARSAAIAICMFANWVANLALTLTFPYLDKLLTPYVFLVFTVIVAVAVVVIFTKVPETKGRSVEEIMAHFAGRKHVYDESSGKLMMPNTNV